MQLQKRYTLQIVGKIAESASDEIEVAQRLGNGYSSK